VANRLSPVLLALQRQKEEQGYCRTSVQLVKTIRQLSQLEDEARAVELALQATCRLCDTELCFYLRSSEKMAVITCLSRGSPVMRNGYPWRWSSLASCSQGPLRKGKELDVLPQHQAGFLVRQAFTAHRIERVFILPVQSSSRYLGSFTPSHPGMAGASPKPCGS